MITERIATVTLTSGTVVTAEYSEKYDYFYIRNDTADPVYVSMESSSVVAGADGVLKIPSGQSCGTMHGYHANKLYLLGDGDVQICGCEKPVNPFSSKGGGGGEKGEKGDKGDTGPQGPQGPQGPKGDPCTLPVATSSVLGGIIKGNGIKVESDGTTTVQGMTLGNQKTITTPGWYRLYDLDVEETNGMYQLFLNRGWADASPETFCVSIAYTTNGAKFTLNAKNAVAQGITKIRFVYDSHFSAIYSKHAYIEIYYSLSNSNPISSMLMHNKSARNFDNVIPIDFSAGEIPSGYASTEFDLSQKDVQDQITALKSYSLTEQIIGTWVDGRPIYKKTVSCGQLPNTSYKVIAHNIANLDKAIDVYGFAYTETNAQMTLQFASPASGGTGCVCVGVNSAEIVITTGSDRSSYTGSYVTLEYTKTSD